MLRFHCSHLQAAAKVKADRKRLTEQLRTEKDGRERAEGLLIRLEKQQEAAAAKAAAADQARLRAERDVQTLLLELQQAEWTIQSLLRQIIQVKEEQSAASSGTTAAAGKAVSARRHVPLGGPGPAGGHCMSDTRRCAVR